ncbi:MaoC/PaaZ C-terminal domain-containing protein [Sphingomonas solaris]|uniref:Uncharacterized protein n=1 Tax=Alterirhizorhabdus solaris TaxID=2529389 RepID=A0A558RB50_9SPHN|nr:MaoC/PaaZ C-terminal domain-containing protein [Sphingomonas solaris]TVV76635.1 hypothetical protein FOY91_03655 [Sphingomonas solaris]
MDDRRPAGARVTLDMIGSTSGDQPVAWDERATMLYALGVGAGLDAPAEDLALTTENSEGVALQALPSFLTIVTVGHKPPALEALDPGRFLHAEQRIELLRPLPPRGRGIVRTTVDSVLDKGEGAIVTSVSTLHGEGPGAPLIGRGTMSIFVRGGGGFGGPRGPGRPAAAPVRPADATIVHHSRPEQALLYRLSGDRHPLHSDPAFARARGFDRPILHGLCTYGFACRALVAGAAGGDPARLTQMAGRFRKPVYPGDTLTTHIWLDGGGAVRFETRDGAGDAGIEHGTAAIAS